MLSPLMAASLCSMNNHKPTTKKKKREEESNWPVRKKNTQPAREDTLEVHLVENLVENAQKKGGQRAGHHGFFMTTLTLR